MKNISFQVPPTAVLGDLLTIHPSLMTHFTNWGRSVLCLLSVCWLAHTDLNAQVSLSASAGTASGSYTTLSAAFTAINAGTHQGAITITVTGSTTEPTVAAAASASLSPGNGAGPAIYTSVTISPSGAATITGAATAGYALIDLLGADNVTFDGLNTGGNSLTISNTTVSATGGTSTIRFVADATSNTIRKCTVLGSATVPLATNGGTIYFATGSVTGNDNNTIADCNIGAAGANLPSKAIYGNGTTTSAALANSDISITNCNIYDFFLTGGCAGVYALTGNTKWSMTNNKVYQTATRTFTAAGTMYGLYFANSTYGEGITMTGNTIGYASSTGTGTYTLTGTVAGVFYGIFLTVSSSAATACNLNTNVISDIRLTSSTGAFYGIYNDNNANGNTININGNTLRNWSLLTSTGVYYGVWWTSATNLSVSNNTVDNLTRNTSGTTYGLYSGTSSVNELVNNNIVSNLTNTSVSTSSVTIRGIYQNTASGTKEFKNNRIFNISTTATGTSNTLEGMRVGYGTTVDISGNTIYGISGLGTTVNGIYCSGATTGCVYTVYKNKIYNLASTHANAVIYGLYTVSQTYNVYNNFIGDLRATAANVGIAIGGIYVSGGTATNLYNNTIYLNATSTGALFGTTAVYASSTAPLRMNNNLLVNTSTPRGALGFTAAFRRSAVYNATYYNALSDNNSFYAGTPGLNNVIFYDGTNSNQTLAAYKTFVASRDQSSFTTNPTWVSTTGADATYLHIPASATPNVLESAGSVISSFTTDFDDDARPGPAGSVNGGAASYDIGADEFDGKPAIPTIGALAANLPTTQCAAAARTITAMVTPVAPVTAVTLYYTTNGANLQSVAMTGGDPGVASNWTATIPVANPANGTIAWYVGATDGTYSVQKVGTSYADEPFFGITATASATPATVCAGSTSNVTLLLTKPNTNVSVGAGATTSSTYPNPFYTNWGHSKNQYLILASELTAAGLGAGNLTALSINITSGTSALTNFAVNIGQTSATVMTTTFLSGLTSVYTTATLTPVVGTNTITFSTPFTWDGTSNLVIQTCFGNPNTTTVSSTATVDNTSYVSMAHWNVTATTTAASTCGQATASTTYTIRPKFTFTGTYALNPSAYSWSDGASIVGTTKTITPNVSANTTYTVTATGPANCTITANTPVAALALPSTPTGTSTAQCGTRVPSCSVTSTSGAATPVFRWYKTLTGGVPLAGESGASLTAYSIAANDTFYVAEYNGTCESVRTRLTVSVTTPELLSLSQPVTTCNNGTVALQVTSALGNFDTYYWSPAAGLFTNPAGTNAYVAGTSATQVYAKNTTVGALTYTCNSANAVCTNQQSTTVNVLPTSITANPVGADQLCTSGAATINIAATPVGAGLQWQESPDGSGFADVMGGTGATSATYTTQTLTQTNYYRLALKKSNGAECAYSNTVTVTVNTPSVGTSEHGTRCGPGAVTLNVSGNNGDINWFTAATGGTAIATGNRYIPTLSTIGTTPFYVEASINASTYTGLGSSAATIPPTTGASSERGIVFTATKNFRLVSAQYYSPTLSVTNTVTVSLLNDADGSVLNTVVLPIVQGATAAWYTMNLNFDIRAGRTYRLLASFSSSVNRIDSGADYTTAAFNNLGILGTITGGYDSGITATSYNYFHNINAMEICISPRQVVNATLTTPPALTLSTAATALCAGTPNSAVSVSSTLSDFDTYTWSPAAGVTGTTSPVFNPSATTTYTLSAAQAAGSFCQNNTTLTVKVNPLPSTPTITPATALLCTGDGAIQLAAVVPGIVQKIGSPDSSNTLLTYPAPYNNYFGGAKHQMLFTAAELTAAGLAVGSPISAIKLTVTAVGTTFTGSLQNFHLKVGHTTLTTLGTTFEAGLTEVVAPSTVPVAVGNIQHTFSNAFVWNGISNLILETSYSNANTGTSSDGVRTEFTTGLRFNGSNYYRADRATATAIATATAATPSTSRPNVTFVTLPVNGNWQALTTGLYTDAAATTPYVSGTIASVYAKPSVTTTYTATIVSDAGCTSTSTRTVTVGARPVAQIANSRPTTFCAGDSTVLTASGDGNYLWSTGATSAAITVRSSGVYKVKVTSAAGCVDSTMVTVTVNARPTAAIANNRPTTFCAGDSTVLTASGDGTYSWSTGETTASVTAKVSGTYKVLVTNALGCADSATIVVTSVARLAPVIANSRPTTFCTGDSTVLTASATGAATYAWSTGATTASVTALTAGIYKVTVTSASGCVDSTMATITVNTRPTAGVTNNRPTTFCAGDSTILTASGGGTYTWSTGATTAAVTARTSGTYKVSVTNAAGCVDSTMIAVTANARPTAAITGATAICTGDSTTFTATGGGTYVWSTAATSAGIIVRNAGTYKVTVTNAAGCVDSTTITLVINARPTAILIVSGVATFCQGDSTVLKSRGGVTYRWTTPTGTSTDSSVIAKVTGVYKVLAFNALGCSDSANITITVNPKPTVSFTSTSLGANATFTNASTGGSTYSWNFGDATALGTTMNATHAYTANGTYQVKLIVTSAAGCRDSIINPIVITRVANEEILAGLKALVYPNPTARNLHIEFQTTTIQFGTNDFISVTDAFGREVYRQAIGGNFMELNTENWASGLYMINAVISNQKIGLSKVVKIDK